MEVYLDNSATTKPSQAAVQAINRALTEIYGNPSSLHRQGLLAEKLLKKSRSQITNALGVAEDEFVFTSGGTEANNLAILGSIKQLPKHSNYLITTEIEHPSTLNIFKELERKGYPVTYLRVTQKGIVDLNHLQQCLLKKPALISIMMVNNEIGTVQPIAEISKMIASLPYKPIFHSDAVQAFGKLKIDLSKTNVDLLSISAHKFHGPKGIGGLYIRKGTKLGPLFYGGSQEFKLRPGTENLPAIAGMAAAAEEFSSNNLTQKIKYIEHLRTRLLIGITKKIENVKIISPAVPEAVPNILNVAFLGIPGEVLLHGLEEDGIYISTRSACSSNKKEQSHVLTALGLRTQEIESAVRFSLSIYNTETEIDYTIDRLHHHVTNLRQIVSGRGYY